MGKTRLSRRQWLAMTGGAYLVGTGVCDAVETTPFFKTRGVVVIGTDTATFDWPARARQAGLTTVAIHLDPVLRQAYVKSDVGQAFLAACKKQGIEVEYEAHAMNTLLPRDLFGKSPDLFRMDDQGRRVADWNLCVSSEDGVALVCENAAKFARACPPTTHRYYFWSDDGQPMCRCPKCRELSDADQALLLENRMLKKLRETDPAATLAHLAYSITMKPPEKVKPEPGIFLEFAPIQRRLDKPLRSREVEVHAQLQDALDANLAVFGADGAQALEYWLDESLRCGYKKDERVKLNWVREVVADDLAYYAGKGIRHVTTFAVWVDGAYVAKCGEPPLDEYGTLLRSAG